MRKIFVSLAWFVVLEIIFYSSYIWLLLKLNPNMTQEESYANGAQYGLLVLLAPLVLVVILATTGYLPGARKNK